MNNINKSLLFAFLIASFTTVTPFGVPTAPVSVNAVTNTVQSSVNQVTSTATAAVSALPDAPIATENITAGLPTSVLPTGANPVGTDIVDEAVATVSNVVDDVQL